MEVIRQIAAAKKHLREESRKGRRIAFVPTMGALHAGHRRLIETAREKADLAVLSIFVNPTQFNDPEDLQNYPRDEEADLRLAEEAGADIAFVPTVEEIYPPGFFTSVNVGRLSTKLEGASRPGHFRGVCTVVLKLLEIVRPDHLVLGLKDAQQFTILQHMVDDLCLDTEVVGVPTVRQARGLGCSSRNILLTPQQRRKALCMYRALKRTHFLVKKQGILHTGELLQAIRSAVQTSGVELDYAAIVSRVTLEPLEHVVRGGTYVLIAIRIGKVRLIDNTRI